MVQQQITEVQETTVSVKEAPTVKTYQAKKAIFRSYQVIWYIVGVIEILLAFRIALKLLGANSYSGFANFIYSMSSPFAQPFVGLFQTTASSNLLFEWSTVIAMIVYMIVAYGGVALLQLVKPTNQVEVEQAVDNT